MKSFLDRIMVNDGKEFTVEADIISSLFFLSNTFLNLFLG
jgi:hypothetical protein